MKKILVVDDEADIRKLLKEYLEMEGYLVYTARTGIEALEKIKTNPDLILLDINMPDFDGYTVCNKVRDYVSCPIIFLTARTEEADKVNGFRAGGDDYVIKPFGIDELLARIKAHLRREERKIQSANIYIDGDMVVDFSGRKVYFGEQDISLTKTEFQIVEFLLQHRGQVLDKEKIYEAVRGYEGEADASIVMEHIRRIRKKIGKIQQKEYIETVWGMGYKWIG